MTNLIKTKKEKEKTILLNNITNIIIRILNLYNLEDITWYYN